MDIFDIANDMKQDEFIRANEIGLNGLERDFENSTNYILMLNKRIDHLTLITEAMWNLLKKNSDFSEKDLRNMINELDLKDGVIDKENAVASQKFPECDAMICSKLNRCLFCGYIPLAKETTPFSEI